MYALLKPNHPRSQRWIAGLIVLLMGQVDLKAAPALVQSNTAVNGGNSSSITATYTSTPTAGNLLIAIVGNKDVLTLGALPAGWTKGVADENRSPGLVILYKIAGVAEPSDVTINYSGSTRLGLQIFEYSGIPGATLRQFVETSGSGTSLATGTVTSTTADELIITGFTIDVGTTFTGWSNSFTERTDVNNGGAPAFAASYALADRVATVPGSYQTTATVGSSGAWLGMIARFSSTPNQACLWLSSKTNAAVPPLNGGISWTDGEVVQLSDPNLSLVEPGTSNGTFSTIGDIDDLAGANEDIVAMHYVTRPVTVGTGSNAIALQIGDVLFSLADDATFSGLLVQKEDVALFRPTVPGNYSAGSVSMLLDNMNGREINAIAVVERACTVGTQALNAGDVLASFSGDPFDKNIHRCVISAAGAGVTSATVTTLLEGSDMGFGGAHIAGLSLVCETTYIGGIVLNPGAVLLSLESSDAGLGTNNLPVDKYDIFALNVSVAEPGVSTATAIRIFEGADAGIFSGGEEFDAISLVTSRSITGTVYEDVNYGGGIGRDRSTALANGGTRRANARVELYNASGSFLSFTNTDAMGQYEFSALPAGTYTVRVVNSTVSSARAGYVANTHLAVQTYRTNASTGAVVAVTDRVGGEVPGKVDAGNGSTTLAALTTASTTAQSVTTVAVGATEVTNVDFGYSYNVVVNKNDAGQGSLRQVMTNMNALSNAGLAIQGRTAGIDHGVFMLADGVARPGLTVTYATMFVSGAATIVPLTPMPSITTPMLLDATTHPLFSTAPIIEINGTSAGATTDGFTLAAGSTGSTVKGFVINRFLGDGIQVNAGGNLIQGNYIGVNVAGTAASANTLTGVNIAACANNVIGGTAAGHGNTIAGNGGAEISISGAASTGNLVQGNNIGTRYNATSVIASAGQGILLANTASNNSIGGTVAGAGNVIGGNAQAGIEIKDAGTSNNTVAGNYIGTNASDAGLGNTLQGVKLQLGATNNMIGGTVPGAGNIIAYNGAQGVALFSLTDIGNRILGNSIHDNTLIGIDLGNDGVSYNDNGDPDTGPNGRQNFPKLTSATTLSGNTSITGTFNSTSNATFRIEYFSSPIGDGTGYGEGTTFLGTNNITTNAGGTASINVTFTGVTVPSGYTVCATATNVGTNNTSEFSAFAAAPTDSDNDGVTDDVDIDDDNDGIPDDIEDLGFDSRGGTIACTQPAMDFQNPVLDAGTANTPGAIYRFTNVLPGIDARLSIVAMNNASLVTVDDGAQGTPDSWQPVIDFTGIGTPGVDFNMQFVVAGTTTPPATVRRFGGTTYDVDGVTDVESFLFTAPSVYAVDQPTLLAAQTLPGGLVDISGDGTTDGAGISSDPRYRGYFQYKNTNQFNFRCQFKRTTAGTTQRYLSLRFNECFLNDLINVQLFIVDGLDTDNDGVPDYLDLDSDNDGIYDVVEAGSGQPQTNGILNGGVSTSGLKVSVDANLNNAIDYTLRDSDGDNNYDGVELDSDGDGCFDVTEAGFIDQNADGRLGNDPVLVNGRGVVTSGSGGYTTPADVNANSVYDYREDSSIAMSCPGNITVTTGAGQCTANVTVPAPLVTSACRGYAIVNSFNGISDASGAYPIGITTVNFIVTDATGGSAACSMTVTVNDVQSPTISCPANVNVNASAGQCSASPVALGSPIATYGCDVATITNNALVSYPVGTTPVTWTLSTEDIPGYLAPALIPSCVPSNAFPGPVNSTGGSITLSSSTAIYNTVANALTTPSMNGSASALCDGMTCAANGATASTLTVTPGLGTGVHGALNLGTTISANRQYTSVNIPNDGLLTVNGNRIIRCQGTFQMGTNTTLSINGDVVIHANDFNADNDFNINVVSGSLVIISGNDFNVGNRARFTAPTPTDLLVLSADDISIQVDFIGKAMLYATDRVQFWPNSVLYGAMTGNNVQVLPDATVFGLASGYYCLPTYLDPPQIINNFSAATNSISYPENATSVLIDLQTDDNLSSEASGLTYSLTGPDAGDFAITATTGVLSFAATPNYEAPADANLDNVYQITVTVTDIDGFTDAQAFTITVTNVATQTGTCVQNITVVDAQPPTISCPANITVPAAAGACTATVTYAAPVGTDNCSGSTTVRIAGPASGSVFPLGTTTITHRVTDAAGYTAQCSFTVTVTDTQNPTISCPANITVNVDPGSCSAVVNYVAPVGTDNCSGATTVRIAGPASGSTFAPGVTTITHRVTDGAGNTATCSFTVTVIAGNDNDADGLCDNVDLDDDNDGLLDVTEGGAALDTDGDGVPNRFDLDSDNDGIYDCVESGSGQAFTAGVLNGGITANGIPVSVDANANNVVDYTIRDSDGDGTIDSLELDADADGCNDVIEAGYTDANSDGRLGPAPLTVNARGVVTSGGP